MFFIFLHSISIHRLRISLSVRAVVARFLLQLTSFRSHLDTTIYNGGSDSSHPQEKVKSGAVLLFYIFTMGQLGASSGAARVDVATTQPHMSKASTTGTKSLPQLSLTMYSSLRNQPSPLSEDAHLRLGQAALPLADCARKLYEWT